MLPRGKRGEILLLVIQHGGTATKVFFFWFFFSPFIQQIFAAVSLSPSLSLPSHSLSVCLCFFFCPFPKTEGRGKRGEVLGKGGGLVCLLGRRQFNTNYTWRWGVLLHNQVCFFSIFNFQFFFLKKKRRTRRKRVDG